MFQTTTLSPLHLKLDENNPRFKVILRTSQEDIRIYMLMNEDLLTLAKKINDMGVLLPGERLVVVEEDGENIVLEGNRRTAIYQMFLDRNLVPSAYERVFPYPNQALINEISSIPIDLVESREIAMPYLAARHIEGVRQWSSVSKWRISFDYYQQGKNARDIADILMLSPSDTKKFICNYKILNRGISSSSWTDSEKGQLTLLNIEPDKLIRIFRTRDATSLLNLSFDEDFNLISNTSYITKEKIDKLIIEFTRKAFIENSLNTRSSIYDEGIYSLILNIIPELHSESLEPGEEEPADPDPANQPENQPGPEPQPDSPNSSPEPNPGMPPARPNSRQMPYFFDGLNPSNLNRSNQLCHGLLQICKEISVYSTKRLINDLPSCGAFLIRSLVEQSIIYYSKTHNVSTGDKLIWQEIAPDDRTPKLSTIIGKYCREGSAANYIPDTTIRAYFVHVFSNYNNTANPLNWVIHNPSSFMLSPEQLTNLPRAGLLSIINYFIA